LFASLLVSGTINNITEIDKLITEHLTDNWSFDRINKVALAILRVSIYELKFQPDSVAKIVIDEAVNIAKQFGADDSYKFINAILDKLGNND
jgi:N utilization substance protein B